MKKGFTLLELVVVIVIIGILATLGLVQYGTVMEKGRSAEAKSALGLLRTLESAYYQEPRATATYATVDQLLSNGLPAGTTGNCADTDPVAGNYYYQYECNTTTGTCTAHRCTTGGKNPNATGTPADITLNTAGVMQ